MGVLLQQILSPSRRDGPGHPTRRTGRLAIQTTPCQAENLSSREVFNGGLFRVRPDRTSKH